MHPVLLHLGGLEVRSYGLFLAAAFAAGIAVAYRRAARHGLNPEWILEIGIAALLGSLLGSRLLWVVTHRDAFHPPHGHAWDVLGLSGLSMQGGIVLASALGVAWILHRGAPLLRTLDVVLPSLALGEAIARIGCFLNGCCFGLACALPWAVHFPAGSLPDRVFPGQALHPTQLYAAAGSLALFAGLSRWLVRAPAPGRVAAGWLVGAGALRLLVDVFRYYEPSVTLFRIGGFAFTVNTPVSLGMIVAGAILAASAARGPTPTPGAKRLL